MLVGGWVRDYLIGIESKDFDIEVYGLEPARLRSLLESMATVNTVGEQFSVYKLVFYDRSRSAASSGDRFEIDVSLPRRESKSGRGHRGFVIQGDPGMTIEEAARRRDFTINAILYDPLVDEIIDPFGGARDIEQRILRAVDPDTFIEDSLRVLRAVQFAARYEMTIDPRTIALCRTIDLSDLPHERIWGEIEKLLLLARRPSLGLDAALELGVLDKLFPEIRALVGCPQDPRSHPEGDAFTHTRLALDEAAKLLGDLPKSKSITVMLATLCHDLGKPLVTRVENGSVLAPEHDKAGEGPALSIMERLGVYTLVGFDVRAETIALVKQHLTPRKFYDSGELTTDGDFRRLALRVDIDLLYRVDKACALSRGPASAAHKQDWFIERARRVGVEHGPPARLLLGRHLLQEGFEPGPHLGRLLDEVYELQLDGKVRTLDEAIAAVHRMKRNLPQMGF
jgi:tRNA nucleotidyltransferase (CCA-adding enzyme)